MTKPFDSAVSFLPPSLCGILSGISVGIKDITYEIRLRADKCITLITSDGVVFADKEKVTYIYSEDLYKVSSQEIKDSFNRLCNYSVYTHAENIAQGFITLTHGHRVGICGTAVKKNNCITSIRSVNSLNIRIAKEFKGCSDMIMSRVFKNELKNIIIAGPPSSGKTTLLRDIARQISSGRSGDYKKVAIVDERCEIVPVNDGICNFDSGFNTDILSSFPKTEGIMCALRTLSPELIVCDEIGTSDECEAILSGLNSGVCFALSIHASDINELKNKPQFRLLLKSGFQATVVLLGRRPCEIKDIIQTGECYVENNCDFTYCGSISPGRAVC